MSSVAYTFYPHIFRHGEKVNHVILPR